MHYFLVILMMFPSGETGAIEFRDQFQTYQACASRARDFVNFYVDPEHGLFERAIVFCNPPA